MKNQKLKNVIIFIFLVHSNIFFAVKKQRFTPNQSKSISVQLIKAGYANFDDLSKLSVNLAGKKISRKIIEKSVDQAYQNFVTKLNALGSSLDPSIIKLHLPQIVMIVESCNNKFYKIKKL